MEKKHKGGKHRKSPRNTKANSVLGIKREKGTI